jgi:hypothetical protein
MYGGGGVKVIDEEDQKGSKGSDEAEGTEDPEEVLPEAEH